MIETEECGCFLGSSSLAWKCFRGGLNLVAQQVRVGVVGKGRGWGWLNQGLVWHNGESGTVVNKGASGNMSSIFHPRHFQMGCGIFRSLEPVELGRDGWQSYCLCSAWGSDWGWAGRQECSRLAWCCCVCLGGGLKYLKSNDKKLDFCALMLFALWNYPPCHEFACFCATCALYANEYG